MILWHSLQKDPLFKCWLYNGHIKVFFSERWKKVNLTSMERTEDWCKWFATKRKCDDIRNAMMLDIAQ